MTFGIQSNAICFTNHPWFCQYLYSVVLLLHSQLSATYLPQAKYMSILCVILLHAIVCHIISSFFTLKYICHIYKIFGTGCTRSFQKDNFYYSQWWTFQQYDVSNFNCMELHNIINLISQNLELIFDFIDIYWSYGSVAPKPSISITVNTYLLAITVKPRGHISAARITGHWWCPLRYLECQYQNWAAEVSYWTIRSLLTEEMKLRPIS